MSENEAKACADHKKCHLEEQVTRMVMVVNPISGSFLRVGVVLDDGKQWKTVDLGFGQAVPVAAEDVMDEAAAMRMVRDAVENWRSK